MTGAKRRKEKSKPPTAPRTPFLSFSFATISLGMCMQGGREACRKERRKGTTTAIPPSPSSSLFPFNEIHEEERGGVGGRKFALSLTKLTLLLLLHADCRMPAYNQRRNQRQVNSTDSEVRGGGNGSRVFPPLNLGRTSCTIPPTTAE